jgi:hypothetical protein
MLVRSPSSVKRWERCAAMDLRKATVRRRQAVEGQKIEILITTPMLMALASGDTVWIDADDAEMTDLVADEAVDPDMENWPGIVNVSLGLLHEL